MDDILEYLEEATHPEELGPEYRVLLQKMEPAHDALLAVSSIELMDQWFDANAEISVFECQEAFSRGFRLGARLILALAAPSSPSTHHRS